MYASQALNEVQQRYSQTVKEALDIPWACKKFKLWLLCTKIILPANHKPPTAIFDPHSNLRARIQNWVLGM
jgi:hypothetical protein